MINSKLNYFVIGSVLTFFVVGGIMTYAKMSKNEVEEYIAPKKETAEIIPTAPVKEAIDVRVDDNKNNKEDIQGEDDGAYEDKDENSASRTPTSIATATPKINPTSQIKATPLQTYTLAVIAKHNTKESCYTSIDSFVYDLTPFINNHPGGEALLVLCGKEGTALFNAQHEGNPNPTLALVPLKIGSLVAN